MASFRPMSCSILKLELCIGWSVNESPSAFRTDLYSRIVKRDVHAE